MPFVVGNVLPGHKNTAFKSHVKYGSGRKQLLLQNQLLQISINPNVKIV